MKKRIYDTHIIIDVNGNVKTGHCTCISRKSGHCKHVFALLWSILDYIIEDKQHIDNQDIPCTSKPRTWGCDSKKTVADSNEPFSKLYFIKHDPTKPKKNTVFNIQKRYKKSQKFLNVKLTSDSLKKYGEMLYAAGLGMCCAVAEENEPVILDNSLLNSNNTTITNTTLQSSNSSRNNMITFPEQLSNEDIIHQRIELPLEEKWSIELINILESNNYSNTHDLLTNCSMSLREARELEEKTRAQNKCNQWYRERRIRITSTKFAAIIRRKKHVTQEFLKHIWPNSRIHIRSAFMELGSNNEEAAVQKYLALNPHFKSFECGLCVNPGVPFLAATPDRLIYDTITGTHFLLEIKTLAKGGLTEKLNIQECIHSGYAPFLQCKNGIISLKTSHSHYYQIQGQLALTGLEFCVLLVDSGEEIYSQKIVFNKEEWVDDFLPDLIRFYFTYFRKS